MANNGKLSKVGYKGVYKRANTYQSVLAIGRFKKTLGSFKTPEEASKARREYIISLL